MHTYSDKQVLRGAVGVHKTGCCNGQTNIKILNNVFYDPCVFLLQKKTITITTKNNNRRRIAHHYPIQF